MAPNNVRRIDNHRVFRPEAVEAWSTRRAGEPWHAHAPWERLLIVLLTLLTVAAMIALWIGGR
jgi:hypothetical protein